MSTATQEPDHHQQQAQQPEPPCRQPSFIGLPPISPGPEFGSALGITAADFNLDGLEGRDTRRDTRDHRAASPPAPVPVPAPVPRQLPSPHPWLNGNPDTSSSSNNSRHDRADSTSAASVAQSSPSMSNYAVHTTSAYRPSQGYSMQGAYSAVHPSQAQQQPVSQQYQQQHQQQQYQQQYHNGAQHAVNGNGIQQRAAQPSFQNGGQGAASGNGNGAQQQPGQPNSQLGAQYAANNGNGNGNSIQQQPVQPTSQYALQNSHPGIPAPASYQQFAARTGAPPGMPSPSLQSNGTFVLPPGWKMEQSQLQQPLSSPRHRPSPSISSLKQQKDNYEIDKETGARSTRSVSPPTHSPTEMRRPEHPPQSSSMGESAYQNGYAPPKPPFAQGQGSALGRVSTNNSQGSYGQEERDGRRNSGMLSSIRNRLGGSAQQGFDATKATFPADDGVSEASVPTDEQARKGSLFGLRGNGQPDSEGRASCDVDADRSAFGQSEKKRAFFTRPTGLSFGSSSGQDQQQPSRPATTEGVAGPPPIGFGPGPKKRFSKLSGMLNRDKPEPQLSQPQGYTPTQNPMGRPSLTGQRPFQGMQAGGPNQGMYMGPPSRPMGDAQMGVYGRSRSATNESRPSIGDQAGNQAAQGLMSPPPMGAISEEDRSRKASGGNILSNIFGKRPDSKSREQQLPSSPPGLGQPQGMMNQGQTPPRLGNPGQFPSFLAHSLGMPGQPLIPPQGQYAGLAHQVQQQQFQQQFLGQPLPPGMTSERFNAYLQGGPSPGVSPITQSSGSPFTTKPSGPNGEARPGVAQQGTQGPLQQSQQRNQDPRSPIGSVQIATAVPIRQVERSPNSSSGHYSGQNSPQGDNAARGRSASFVNQIEIGAPKRPNLDPQNRTRSASSSVAQQHPVHIASLQAPVRKPVHSSSPRNSTHLGPQETSSIDTEKQHSVGQPSTQDSPSTRRVSRNLSAVSQNASQLTPSTSPAPSQEQQPTAPGVPLKNLARSEEELGMPQQLQADQGHPSLASSQNSVYRPSGPQLSAASQQQPAQPQRTWGATERPQTESQNVSGHSAHPGYPSQTGPPSAQYYMQGRPPQDMRMTAPPQEERQDKEGTFARMLKTSKTFVQERTQTSNEKPKGEKESRSAKILGAFTKKPKQVEVASPPPPQGPPGGPAWSTAPVQSPSGLQRPIQGVASVVSAAPGTPTPEAPTQQLVTQGLQQMPSKAQQLLGQPPNSMYQAPPDQPPSKARPSTDRTNSQPYQNYQDERQTPGKSTPPLSPDQIQGTPAVQQPNEASQPPAGRPSTSSLPPHQESSGMPSQQQQQQQPTQTAAHNPMAAITHAKNRAHMLKQQLAPHAPAQQNPQEPQYAQVPIPQGYATVYAGRAVNPPPAVSPPTYAQPFQTMPGGPYQGQPQQWVHPAMIQGMMPGQLPPGMPPQSMPPHMLQGAHVQYQYPPQQQGTPPPMMVMAPYPTPHQQYMPGQQPTPSPPAHSQIAPPSAPMHQPVQQQYMPEQHVTPSPPVPGQMPPSGVSPPPPQQQQQQQQQQQTVQQSIQQPGWQQSITAPNPRQIQHAQAAPQQTSAPPQPAGPAHVQLNQYAPAEVAGPAPANAVSSVSQAQQHFSVVPDVVTASPLQSTNGSQQQIYQPAPVKLQSDAEPQQTVPRSAFAVHAAPQTPEQSQLQPSQGPNENLLPQRQISAASQVSSMTTEPATSKGSPDIQRIHVIHPVESVQPIQPASPERQRGVTLKDEPLPKVDTPVTATPANQDDIYGATPRQSAKTSPVFAQEQNTVEHVIVSESAPDEVDSKFAGMPNNKAAESRLETKVGPSAQQSFIVDAPPVIVEPKAASPERPSPSPPLSSAPVVRSKSPLPDDEPPSPTDSELKADQGDKHAQEEATGEGLVTVNGKPVQSSQEIFEEHKRKQLVRDMEEKIALMPEPEMLEPVKKKKDEDVPTMSATSYPGQEWNPYGEGFEDDDE